MARAAVRATAHDACSNLLDKLSIGGVFEKKKLRGNDLRWGTVGAGNGGQYVRPILYVGIILEKSRRVRF